MTIEAVVPARAGASAKSEKAVLRYVLNRAARAGSVLRPPWQKMRSQVKRRPRAREGGRTDAGERGLAKRRRVSECNTDNPCHVCPSLLPVWPAFYNCRRQ